MRAIWKTLCLRSEESKTLVSQDSPPRIANYTMLFSLMQTTALDVEAPRPRRPLSQLTLLYTDTYNRPARQPE